MLVSVVQQRESAMCIYTYIPYLLGLPPTPPTSHPSRSSQSTKVSSLCCMAASYWLSVLHVIVVYMSVGLSRFIPPSLSSALGPHVHPLCLCLHSCPANRFISIIFHICNGILPSHWVIYSDVDGPRVCQQEKVSQKEKNK